MTTDQTRKSVCSHPIVFSGDPTFGVFEIFQRWITKENHANIFLNLTIEIDRKQPLTNKYPNKSSVQTVDVDMVEYLFVQPVFLDVV